MNDIVKKLAEMSGADTGSVFADILCQHSQKLVDAYNEQSKEVRTKIFCTVEQNQQKFARLIIEECVKVLLDNRYENARSEYYEGFNEALSYASIKIKQHFGVNE